MCFSSFFRFIYLFFSVCLCISETRKYCAVFLLLLLKLNCVLVNLRIFSQPAIVFCLQSSICVCSCFCFHVFKYCNSFAVSVSLNEMKFICIARTFQSFFDDLEPFLIVVACVMLLCSTAFPLKM